MEKNILFIVITLIVSLLLLGIIIYTFRKHKSKASKVAINIASLNKPPVNSSPPPQAPPGSCKMIKFEISATGDSYKTFSIPTAVDILMGIVDRNDKPVFGNILKDGNNLGPIDKVYPIAIHSQCVYTFVPTQFTMPLYGVGGMILNPNMKKKLLESSTIINEVGYC